MSRYGVRTCLADFIATFNLLKDLEMSKLKTKSSAKKRFSFTATGKARGAQAGKRHNMRKRTNDMLRDSRGTRILAECETARVRKYLPYA